MTRPFVPIPHGIEAVIKAHADGLMSPSVMTFGFKADNALPDATDISNVVGVVTDWITNDYKGLVAGQVIFDQLVVRSLAEHFGPEETLDLNEPATGGDGDVAALSILVLIKSLIPGRSTNGRSYGFFPPRSVIDVGHWSSTYVAQIQSTYTTLKTASGDALYPLAIASRKFQTMTLCANIDTMAHFSYQTRRDPNRG